MLTIGGILDSNTQKDGKQKEANAITRKRQNQTGSGVAVLTSGMTASVRKTVTRDKGIFSKGQSPETQ